MQKDFLLKVQNETVRGFIHHPQNMTLDTPLVIISHGLTGNKYGSHNLWVGLSRHLAENGVASIRFDFRGNGDSDGLHQDMTVSREVSDLKAVYALAREHSNSITLLGYSLGTIVTSIVSGTTDAKKVLLVAPIAPEVFVQFASHMIPLAKDFPGETFEFTDGFVIGKAFMNEMERLPFGGTLDEFIKNDGKLKFIRGGNDPFANEVITQKYLTTYGGDIHIIDGIEHDINTQRASDQLYEIVTEFVAHD